MVTDKVEWTFILKVCLLLHYFNFYTPFFFLFFLSDIVIIPGYQKISELF